MNTALRAVLALTLLILLTDCNQYAQISKQLPTFANLQEISKELQRRVEAEGSVSAEDAYAFMARYNGGRDAWGTRFIFRSRKEPRFSFIVVSLGSDHSLDVPDIEVYFEMAETDIVGQLKRDIVFRDGHYVTIASAK